MLTETSAAAIAVPVPAAGHASVPSRGAVSDGETMRVPARGGAGTLAIAQGGLARRTRRVASALGDIVGMVVVALAFPLVILAVGIPIALLVRLVVWFVHAL